MGVGKGWGVDSKPRDVFGHVTPLSRRRLGFGVLDPHSLLTPSDETGLYTAWCHFLHAIAVRHPQVLESLVELSDAPLNFRDPDAPTCAAVRRWLGEWHLLHDLSCLAAFGTLRAWAVNPQARHRPTWVYPTLAAWHIPDSAAEPIQPDPFIEDYDTFLARAAALWRARVAELTRAGYRETRVRPALLVHCDWLADFQVGGVSKAAIADREHATRDAVKQGIHVLADLLQLPVRTHRSGRPRAGNQ